MFSFGDDEIATAPHYASRFLFDKNFVRQRIIWINRD